MISRILPYCFMILLLAAHFSRANQNVLTIIVLLLPLLLFIKERWVIHVLQTVAYMASLAWLYSAYSYIQIRLASGDDWVRLLIIIAVVALYTLWSGYFLRSGKILAAYGFQKADEQH